MGPAPATLPHYYGQMITKLPLMAAASDMSDASLTPTPFVGWFLSVLATSPLNSRQSAVQYLAAATRAQSPS
jgi:hypothetical protein